jgi:hypothetical protein
VSADGLRQTATLTYTVDGSAPAVAIKTPADGATYLQHAIVTASFTCTDPDGQSDVVGCVGPINPYRGAPIHLGETIDTTTPGLHVFTVTGRDHAGNLGQTTVHYTVKLPLPSVTGFSLTKGRFALGSGSAAVSSFRFKLSTAATVTIAIDRAVPGMHKRAACVALGRRAPAPRARRCTAFANVGTLTVRAARGPNTVAFTGKVGRRPLAPGSYRAKLTARVGKGLASTLRTVTFTIVAR